MYGMKKKLFESNGSRALLGSLLILSFFVWLMVFSPDHGGLIQKDISQELCIDFINVGEGDAILIKAPNGKAILVDGGPMLSSEEASEQGVELISKVLERQGIKRLQGVLLTHWHSEHLAGLFPVIKFNSISHIYEPPFEGVGALYEQYVKLCNKTKITRQKVHSDMVINLGKELFLQILHPEPEPAYGGIEGQKNLSVVLLLRYGRVQVLLGADVQRDGIFELMKYGDGIGSQIIKVPNHGSEASLHAPFIKAVGAKAGIVMTGRGNTLGNPSTRVLQEYEQAGTRVYRTDLHGNIRVLVGGKDENDFKVLVNQRL
jgi:competence protein ComEC